MMQAATQPAPGRITHVLGDGVLNLTIDNPARLNALSLSMWTSLRLAVAQASERDDLRCVTIRGAGERAFSAGADISEFAETRATYDQVVRFHEDHVLACLNTIAACPVPVVAGIDGACFGGGLEIATVCDIRIATENSRFGAPVGRLGFPLAIAETQALFRLVGQATTAELLLEGRVYDATEAQAKGLVTRVVPADTLTAALEESVAHILKSGVLASRAHKAQLRRLTQDQSPVTREERLAGYAFADTDEYRDGIRAFLEKSTR